MSNDNERKLLECKACGWKWFPRMEDTPRQCPHCKSARWEIGKVRAPGGGSKKKS